MRKGWRYEEAGLLITGEAFLKGLNHQEVGFRTMGDALLRSQGHQEVVSSMLWGPFLTD